MLTPEQFWQIRQGFLVSHKDYRGVWVVVEREGDLLRLLQVNCELPVNLSVLIDDPKISIVDIKGR